MFQTCVLGLPGHVKKFDSNRLLLTVLGLLDPFATQSNKSNIIMINLDVWLKFYNGWIGLVDYIEWLINKNMKAKMWSKDLLCIAFQQKETRALQNPA